jgi:hypothetical protein
MRFIFQILLFMIFFNAMLIILAPYFPTQRAGSTFNPVNYTEEIESETELGHNLSKYQSLNIESMLISFISVFLGTLLITIFIGYISGGTLPLGQLIGASLVISIFVGLWNGLTSPLVGIAASYPSIAPFYTIFTIALGIVLMISIVEIFTGKGDESA